MQMRTTQGTPDAPIYANERHVSHGTNLRGLIRRAPLFGIEVSPVRRTGELRFSHPSLHNTVRVNGRRKDAPRALTAYFATVEQLAAKA